MRAPPYSCETERRFLVAQGRAQELADALTGAFYAQGEMQRLRLVAARTAFSRLQQVMATIEAAVEAESAGA